MIGNKVRRLQRRCGTYESRRIVILDSLSVSERFEDRIRLENLSFELTESLLLGATRQDRVGLCLACEQVERRRGREGVGRNRGEVLNDLFGVLRLTSTGFSAVECQLQLSCG